MKKFDPRKNGDCAKEEDMLRRPQKKKQRRAGKRRKRMDMKGFINMRILYTIQA
jgi:hypothetical protein